MSVSEILAELPASLVDDAGRAWLARAHGRLREDGMWEGWVEFERNDGVLMRTARETTQPNRTDLVYWATGLTPVWLEGAFARATKDELVAF